VRGVKLDIAGTVAGELGHFLAQDVRDVLEECLERAVGTPIIVRVPEIRECSGSE